MAIEWAPWKVPMHRRLEVLSVAFYISCIFSGPFLLLFLPYILYVGGIYFNTILISYFIFIYCDWKSGESGGRGAGYPSFRGAKIWKYFFDYFPIDMVKTVDLPADRHYLVCMFPHGLFCVSTAANFGSDYSKFKKLFPGLRPKLSTIYWNTWLPIGREILLNCGAISASEKSLKAVLNQSRDPKDKTNCDGFTANAVGLVVGGVREAQVFAPNTYKFVCAKRRGFARVGLETGASLVPAISFGENDVYRTINCKNWNPIIRNFIEKHINKHLLLLCGRGLFQYNFGMLPIRHPVTTVVGAPIHLEKTPNPSTEEIDRVHELFCTQLKELFETHKSKYVKNYENVHLEII